MATKEQTCAERIGDYYKSRMETVGALVRLSQERASYTDMANLQDDYADPDGMINAQQAMDELPLAVELVKVVKITLGTGGPGDWFEATLDSGNAINSIVYHFNDWFDHAEIDVSHDEDARAFCQNFVESALYAGEDQ